MPDVPITLVSVLREPLPDLFRFVTWHRRQGIGRFILYLDDPRDPALTALAGIADVTAVPCTAAFWDSVGLAPDARFTKRQCAALTHGYRQVTEGWVAVCDGDERFHAASGSLQSILAKAPEAISALRILPAEIIHCGIDDGHLRFRTPMARSQVERIYGEAAPLVRHNLGLVGHRQGKSVTRAGQRVGIIRQHWAQDPDNCVLPERVLGREDGAVLLHLFDRGYASWREKLGWRVTAWGFPARIADLLQPLHQALHDGGARAEAAERSLQQLYRALHRFDDRMLDALEAAGSLYLLSRDRLAAIDPDLTGAGRAGTH